MNTRPLLFSFAALLSGAACLWSQGPLLTINATDGFTPGQLQQGKPLGSYPLSSFESVNLGNGQLNLFLPLVTVKGRGSVSVPLGVNLTSPIWNVEEDAYENASCDVGSTCVAFWMYAPGATGWNSVVDYGGGTFLFRSAGDYCVTSSSGATAWHRILTRGTFVTPDGTETEFIDQATNPGGLPQSGNQGFNRGAIFNSDNGTSMQFRSTANVTDPTGCSTDSFGATGTMVTSDGTTYTVVSGAVTQIRDRNGNLTAFAAGLVTDSLGRKYGYLPGSSIVYPGVTAPGQSSASRTITVLTGRLSDAGVLINGEAMQTLPQLWPEISNQEDTTNFFNPNDVVKEIDLPDGTKYLFQYHAYGDVAQITLPTGGYIQYDYNSNAGSTSSGKSVVKDSSGLTVNIPNTPVYYLNRSLKERRVYDANSVLISKTDFPTFGEIDRYDGTTGNLLAKEVHAIPNTSADASSGIDYNAAQLGETTQVTYYDTDGATVLQTQSFGYTTQNCTVACQTVQTATTAMNGMMRQTTYAFDNYNNISDQKDYDWGIGAPGGLLSDVQTSYVVAPTYTSAANPMLGLVSEVKVLDGTGKTFKDTKYNYDEYSNPNTLIQTYPTVVVAGLDPGYTGGGVRGNVTTVSNWLNSTTPNSWLNTYQAYDITGNVVSIMDANGHSTGFSYSDGFSDGMVRNTYGFVTQVTNAAKQFPVKAAQYDYNTGQATQVTDINGNDTKFTYGTSGASVDKLTQTTYADGSHSYVGYSGVQATEAANTSVSKTTMQRDQTSTSDQTSGQALTAVTSLDVLGRAVETDSYESSSGYIASDQYYDGLGRVVTANNPWRPGDTKASTTYSYDGLGRVKTVTTADGAVTKTTYTGNQTTVVDPANVSQTMTYDGLGRMTTLADAALTTSYSYDANGNMVQVVQSSQTRTFAYDSLGRLTQSTNPESGMVQYSYDNVGNLLTRTDNRGTVTTNTYDSLNRISTTSYSDGTPKVTYSYDSVTNGVGQLASVATAGVSTTSYTSFDLMGRVTGSKQQTGSQTFLFSYGYNYAGSLVSETYPSGRTVSIGYDGANRQSSVVGLMNGQGTSYINSVGYAANGGLAGYFTNNNKLTLNQLYNVRQQVSAVAVAAGNDYMGANYFAQSMYWGGSNNNGVRLYGKNEYVSNGTGLPATPTFSQTFQYDGVNRLTSASDSGGWSQSYAYDGYGNMWMPPTSNPLPSQNGAMPTSNVYNASNQNPSLSYDQAGNQTSVGSLTVTYDAENRQSAITNLGGGSASMQYDGLGERVVKSLPSLTTTYVFDAFGQLAAEYYSGTVPTPACTTCYLTYDYLGNVRMVTDAGANVVARHDFAPFGQEVVGAGRGAQYGLTTDVDAKFTGQIRDQELGEDFFNARYFTAGLGRFSSVDPGNAGAMLGSSQSWNGYGYVGGNPLAMVDPSGMNCVTLDNGSQADDGQGTLCPGSSNPFVVNVDSDGTTWWGWFNVCAINPACFGPINNQTVGPIISKPTPKPAERKQTPNYCAHQGMALAPQQYTAAGKALASEVDKLGGSGLADSALSYEFGTLYSSFHRGGTLDAQPFASGDGLQKAAYGNYVYGAFFAGAGWTLSDALTAANAYGFKQQVVGGAYKGRFMDNTYSHLPAVNVEDIMNGYNDASAGTLCHQ